MFCRSERLFLRPAWPEDASELHALVNDRAIAANLAQVPWPYTREDAHEFISRPLDPKFPQLLVTLPTAGVATLLGAVGLSRLDGQAELGYWIGRPYWNNGYATEAARVLIRLAAVLGHRRVVASHFVDNPASGRVLENAGFRRTGETVPRWSRSRAASVAAVRYEIAVRPGIVPSPAGGKAGVERQAA